MSKPTLDADAITVRDLYKKHHWQVTEPTFYRLHLLFDKHAEEHSAETTLRNELQAWFVAEHVVDAPLARS